MPNSDEPVVYLRGRLVPVSDAHVSVYDLGIVMGATVTDLLRTFKHKVYRLDDHVRRFYDSCKYAGINPPLDAEQTAKITMELARRNSALLGPEADLAIVYFITPGENTAYTGSAAGAQAIQPTFCIHSFPLPFHLFRSFFLEGLHLVTPSTRHLPPQCIDAKIKHRSRFHFWLAEQEVRRADPSAMPLLLDLAGNLCETSGSNLLLVKNGAVLSPTPRNILLGISRSVVSALCLKLGFPFLERELQVFDALTADEAFVTTTPYCMAPVTRLNGVLIGNGKVGGPVYERILEAWSAEIDLDIRAQILGGLERERATA